MTPPLSEGWPRACMAKHCDMLEMIMCYVLPHLSVGCCVMMLFVVTKTIVVFMEECEVQIRALSQEERYGVNVLMNLKTKVAACHL